MKRSAVLLLSLIFEGLVNAQTPCSFDVATSTTLPAISCDLPPDTSAGSNLDATEAGLSILTQGPAGAVGLIHDRSLPIRRSLNKRVDFSCTSDESCYTDRVKNVLFCANKQTGDVHDSTGLSGNLITNAYTLPDGRAFTCDPQPTSTGNNIASEATTVSPAVASDNNNNNNNNDSFSTTILNHSQQATGTANPIPPEISSGTSLTDSTGAVSSSSSSKTAAAAAASTSTIPSNKSTPLQPPVLSITITTTFVVGAVLGVLIVMFQS